ncbi:MAG: MerR family transcriptional regulator, partial [Polyangiaceae bacterium]
MTNTTDERPGPPGKRKSKKKNPPDEPKGGTLIRVAFGLGGGRLPLEPSPLVREPHPTTANTHGNEPVTDVFSMREVAKLLGLTEARLRTLDRADIVTPSGAKKGRRAYTFQDLIALRATLLLAKDVKLREVARAIGALKKSLPRVTRPLQELRIVSDGRRVVVRAQDGAFEPVTGQLVLDFQVTALRDDVVRMLRPESAAGRARTAYDLYAKASMLDEDPDTWD